MMPSCSKRTAPVNCSRPSSTRRSMRSIEPMDPSKLIPPPTLSFASESARQIISRVKFLVERLSNFSSEHVDQILLRSLLHAGHTSESLDEQSSSLVSDPRQIIELTVKHPFGSAPAM